MIHKTITYKRIKTYEDEENASLSIKIKDGKDRWIGLMGIYRQWKIPGEGSAFQKAGIARQVARLKNRLKI